MSSILWTNEYDTFAVESLKNTTRYNSLVHRLNFDETLLQELAELLTQGCRTYPVDRLSMIFTVGQCALDRRQFIEEAMESMIGTKLDWRLVTVGFEYESASWPYRIVNALFGNIPIVWIKFSF